MLGKHNERIDAVDYTAINEKIYIALEKISNAKWWPTFGVRHYIKAIVLQSITVQIVVLKDPFEKCLPKSCALW